jgi:hypothetical protein
MVQDRSPTLVAVEWQCPPALEAEMTKLDKNDLQKLEDDLDFYTFTGIASPLLKELMSFLPEDVGSRALGAARRARKSLVTSRHFDHIRPMSIAC